MKMLRLPEVEAVTGLSRTTLWRYEQVGKFPSRRKIGPHLVGWRSDEVESWIRARPLADAGPAVSAAEGS